MIGDLTRLRLAVASGDALSTERGAVPRMTIDGVSPAVGGSVYRLIGVMIA